MSVTQLATAVRTCVTVGSREELHAMIAAAWADPWRAFANWERDHTNACAGCGEPVAYAKHCSNACRQRAYRKRKALLAQTGGET
jgi:hypothetical protein